MTADPHMRPKLSYANKLILGPMVRIGTLPMRLLALKYGADIVYTEELIDWKLLRSKRQVNEVLGTIDFVDGTDGTIVFRTSPIEKDRVVLQIGTCDPERALQVGKIVQHDVAGIDINMGCPKKFSVLGGMGAALLKNPSKATEILRTLVQELEIPITCKIRVFPDLAKTLELCQNLSSTGIAAIAVHGRTIDERPQHPNRNDLIKEISHQLKIPVIANGGSREIEKRSDLIRFKEECGCSSVMICRAAEWNCSIFRKEGLLPMEEVIKEYLKLAVDYDNSPSNTKYCIQNILRELQESPLGKKFLGAQTLEQICEIWDLDEYCRTKMEGFKQKGFKGRFDAVPESHQLKLKNGKRSIEEDDIITMSCAFVRNNYIDDLHLPKTRLYRWTKEKRKKNPRYDTFQEEKLFRSIVEVDGKKYSSSFWEKSKKWAEQGAALVCLCSLSIIDAQSLNRNGSLR